MSNVEKISVSLPREMIETIQQAIDLGEYATTSEVIRDAVRRWADEHVYQRVVRTHGIENLRRTIKEATDSLDRGEGIPAEELYAELTARYGAKAKAKEKKGFEARSLFATSKTRLAGNRKAHRRIQSVTK